jgi:alpha-ketoglutarate-dependent taurine dioxygenase
MSDSRITAPGLPKFGATRRKAIGGSQRSLISAEPSGRGGGAPLVIRPAVDGVDLVNWARSDAEFIGSSLREYGAILFQNFKGHSVAQFEQLIAATSGAMMDYRDRSSPRSAVTANVYSSTDHPPDQTILLHNENSYSAAWPLKIYFHCVTPATSGGETPLADCRKVLARLDPVVRDRFRQKQVMYVRNFGDGIGLPWPTAFQTTERAGVEEYCRGNALDFEWGGGDRLRIRGVRPAIATHPQTGEEVWFNQASLFHPSTLEPGVRADLLSHFKEEELPLNAYYGDGSPIEAAALEVIHEAYERETILFPWRAGDTLMLDNMLFAHGRRPFEGARRVVVGMADPWGLDSSYRTGGEV